MRDDLQELMHNCRRIGYQNATYEMREAVVKQQSIVATIMINQTNIATPSDPQLKTEVATLSKVLSLIDSIAAAKRDADNY